MMSTSQWLHWSRANASPSVTTQRSTVIHLDVQLLMQIQNYPGDPVMSRIGSKATATTRAPSPRASGTGDDESWGSHTTSASGGGALTSRYDSVEEPDAQSSLHDDLWRTLTKAGPTQLDIMNIMLGVLEGLMIMHAAGLAHMDMKPGNVILTDAATAKLADFGAACAIDLRTGRLAIGLGRCARCPGGHAGRVDGA